MRVIRLAPIWFLGFMTACGSTTYQQSASDATSHLASALKSFDTSAQTDLASTGSACKAAVGAVGSASALDKSPPSGVFKAEAAALKRAYNLAHAGFSACESAAASLDYPQMVEAETDIKAANRWLAKARELDKKITGK